jgi:hypothetical protein
MEGKIGLDEKLEKHSEEALAVEASDKAIRNLLLLCLLRIELEDRSYSLISVRDAFVALLRLAHLFAFWRSDSMASP